LSILLCVACSSAEPDAGLARNGGAVPVFSGDLGGNPPSPPSADTPADPNDQSEADETASDPEANEGSPTDGRETPPDPLPLDDGASSDADPPGGDGPGDDPADGTDDGPDAPVDEPDPVPPEDPVDEPPPNEVYVGANGLDSNPGTIDRPLATINFAQTLAGPGFTIWILPGTLRYSETQEILVAGSANDRARLFAAPGARPVVDFSGLPRQNDASRGIILRTDGWHVRGLEVQNAGDNGILVNGANNIVEDVILHGNQDTGLQITSFGTAVNSAANNLILNCDSYENFDPQANGEDADGFAAKIRVGPGNVFRGCRAWNNADDGWDFFAADDVVTIEDSWAFLNGIIAGGGNSAGDGNGFKLGGLPRGEGEGHAPHIVRGGLAFDNRTCGYTRNNNATVPVASNCGIGGNADDYCGINCNGDFEVSISGAQAINRARNVDGSLPSLR
jgi:hypothetical protein